MKIVAHQIHDRRVFGRGLAFLMFVIVGSGCERSPLSSMTLYPVTGKVRLADGKPLTSGRVVFCSTKSTITFMATVESDGSFTVKGSSGAGLPEGLYNVRLEMDETKLPPVKGQPNPRKSARPFPAKYLDENESGLTAKITAKDDRPLEFQLAR